MLTSLPRLMPGDSVEIIAPASGCSTTQLMDLKDLLIGWGLNCFVDSQIFGSDLLCANTDEMRWNLLKAALYQPKTKAVICARGGYGSMRLLPKLCQLSQSQPQIVKLFLGMSDITALHLFFMQHWHWPVLHGAIARDRFSIESLMAHKAFLLGECEQIELLGTPLNALAEQVQQLQAPMIGGNLTLVQASIGTPWQMQARQKIILLEDTSERGYRIDRMLEHLYQANIFDQAIAILFGDFIKGEEPDGSNKILPVLKRFAENIPVPVIHLKEIGHGINNLPVPLGVPLTLKLGKQVQLICPR